MDINALREQVKAGKSIKARDVEQLLDMFDFQKQLLDAFVPRQPYLPMPYLQPPWGWWPYAWWSWQPITVTGSNTVASNPLISTASYTVTGNTWNSNELSG